MGVGNKADAQGADNERNTKTKIAFKKFRCNFHTVLLKNHVTKD